MGEIKHKLDTYLDKKYHEVIDKYSPELTKIKATDRILEKTVLPIVPSWISPNQLTFFRYILIPFVIFAIAVNNMLVATLLFALAAFTDALDGALARTQSKITDWGIVNDPLADKLLISSTAAVLITAYISVWLAVMVIGIEVVLILLAYLRYKSNKIVPAKWAGKIKMILQSFGLGFVFLFALIGSESLLLVAEYVLYGAVLFGVMSLIVYRSA